MVVVALDGAHGALGGGGVVVVDCEDLERQPPTSVAVAEAETQSYRPVDAVNHVGDLSGDWLYCDGY